MKIAVIILNWNGRQLLEKFLPSVLEYSGDSTIYVADNASTDDSVELISKNFPAVKIIKNQKNSGYARGYNQALKNLPEDIFVLLNSDVEVSKNWLDPVVAEFVKDGNVVAAQPKILDFKKREYFEYAGAAGGFLDKYGFPFCRGRIFDTLEKDHGQYDDISEIFWASGACLFVRVSAFRQIEGFDEDYFAHQEEIDLCWRLQKMGGKILYIGNAEVFHVGGATLDSANPRKTYFNFRNSLLNLLKNVDGPRVFPILFTRLSLDGLAGLQFLLKGKPRHLVAVIKAHFGFYRLAPKFIRKRKKNPTDKKYYHVRSIVVNYFLLQKKHFGQL